MVAGIYLITRKSTGQKYGGGSINIERRIKQHINNPSKGSRIDNAIQKHGWDDFEWEILEELPADWKIIGSREKYWINFFNAFEDPNHYNLTEGGGGRSGYKKPYEDFEYTIVKAGSAGFLIYGRSHQSIKICKDKSKLESIAEALNNGEITEEEAKKINLNPFEYTIAKAGKTGFKISDRDNKSIKTCKDKSKLESIAEALNNGEITEEEAKEIDLNPFEYIVVKAGVSNGNQQYCICGRSRNMIKKSINKEILDEIAEKLNNGSLTEEEAKAINPNPFKYTVTKKGFRRGKQKYAIHGRDNKTIKQSIDKRALDKITDVLNNGLLTEEEVKKSRGVKKILEKI